MDVWDAKTGQGRPGFEEFNFTVFRHRTSGAAVEIVHDDDEICLGFFRFMSAQIFHMVPDSPMFADFADGCPGWASYVNGHFTGDFLLSNHIYAELKANPGQHSICTTGPFPVGNWTGSVEAGGQFIVLQHNDPACAGAYLVLTHEGLTYLGRNETLGWLLNTAQAIILEGANEPRIEDLSKAWERFVDVLPPPPPPRPPAATVADAGEEEGENLQEEEEGNAMQLDHSKCAGHDHNNGPRQDADV